MTCFVLIAGCNMKRSPQKKFDHFGSVILLGCLILCPGPSGAANAQADALFETASVENRLTRRLKLTKKDLTSLRPLIEQESDELLILYGNYADANSSDFLSLWNALRSRRAEHPIGRSGRLSPRQRRALAIAYSEFERQILDQWLEDYLRMLDDVLELDPVQSKHVQKIFDEEQRERLEIFREEKQALVHLDARWQKIVDERERKIRQVLNASQLRTYTAMSAVPNLVAMGRGNPANR